LIQRRQIQMEMVAAMERNCSWTIPILYILMAAK